MKHFYYLYFLSLFFFLSPYLYAMDTCIELDNMSQPIKESQLTHHSTLEEIITKTDKHINSKYTSNFSFLGLNSLSDEEIVDIASSIHQCYNKITVMGDLINSIMKRNVFFKQAINDCMAHAYNNSNNVNATTIAQVEDPSKKQPIALLNELPKEIKNIIMNSARVLGNHSYVHTLKLDSNINEFALSAAAHKVAIATENKQLTIIDLKTVLINRLCTTEGTVLEMLFNTIGTRLCTTEQIKGSTEKNPFSIIERDANTFAITFEHTSAVFCVARYINDNKMAIHSWKSQNSCHIEYWDIAKKQREGIYLFPYEIVYSKSSHKKDGVYSADNPAMNIINRNFLAIKKKTTYHYDLCAKAIENTKILNTLHLIQESTSYNKLTPFEQRKIREAINCKAMTDSDEKKIIHYPRFFK